MEVEGATLSHSALFAAVSTNPISLFFVRERGERSRVVREVVHAARHPTPKEQ